MKKPKGIKHIWVKLLLVYIALVTINTALVWLITYLGLEITGNFFTFFLLTAYFIIVHFIIVVRIKRMTNTVNNIATGNYDERIEIKGNDELSALAFGINNMTDELNANLRLSKDFSRYISHEFKTPLAVIRNYAEAAQTSKSREKTAEYLQTIISQTDKLTDMTRTALEMSKLDSTTLVKKDDTFCPASQIRSIILGLQFEWENKNIELTPELEEFDIRSNSELLPHIWQNLITNSIKYTNNGGKIDITLKKQEETLVFTVSDTGVGIAPDDLQNIFTPFFTGKTSNNNRDSGLGLPLAAKIAERLGGSITCVSEPGSGSTFTVTLPL